MDHQQQIASFVPIQDVFHYRNIQIIFNQLVAVIDNSPKKSPKYKKVGKSSKALLLEMVQCGSSIVSAATKLGMNYSTAKSIVQSRNKEKKGTQVGNFYSTDESNCKEHSKM